MTSTGCIQEKMMQYSLAFPFVFPTLSRTTGFMLKHSSNFNCYLLRWNLTDLNDCKRTIIYKYGFDWSMWYKANAPDVTVAKVDKISNTVAVRSDWSIIHSTARRKFHKLLVKEGADRPSLLAIQMVTRVRTIHAACVSESDGGAHYTRRLPFR